MTPHGSSTEMHVDEVRTVLDLAALIAQWADQEDGGLAHGGQWGRIAAQHGTQPGTLHIQVTTPNEPGVSPDGPQRTFRVQVEAVPS